MGCESNCRRQPVRVYADVVFGRVSGWSNESKNSLACITFALSTASSALLGWRDRIVELG